MKILPLPYILIAVILGTIVGLILPAYPQSVNNVCGPHEELQRILPNDFKEFPSGAGIASGRFLVELYTGTNGSWTILQTNPLSKMSCILATGTDWQKFISPPVNKTEL